MVIVFFLLFFFIYFVFNDNFNKISTGPNTAHWSYTLTTSSPRRMRHRINSTRVSFWVCLSLAIQLSPQLFFYKGGFCMTQEETKKPNGILFFIISFKLLCLSLLFMVLSYLELF